MFLFVIHQYRLCRVVRIVVEGHLYLFHWLAPVVCLSSPYGMKVKPVNQPETRVLCLKVRSVIAAQAVPPLVATSILESLSYSHRDAEPLLRRYYCGARKRLSGADEPAGGRDNAPSPLTAWCSDWLLLNIHFHMLFLDGVYVDRLDGSVRFRWVSSPTTHGHF